MVQELLRKDCFWGARSRSCLKVGELIPTHFPLVTYHGLGAPDSVSLGG